MMAASGLNYALSSIIIHLYGRNKPNLAGTAPNLAASQDRAFGRVNLLNKPEYLFFDCMETLIDLHKLPALRDYAAWAYEGSGVEEIWGDFDEFFRYYLLAREELSARIPEYADYEMRGRYLHIVKISLPELPYEMVEPVAGKLYDNYWRNYKAGSYVKEDVRDTLADLSGQFKMGVVSNFRIINGIEELLEIHDLRKYFEFVVTSVAEGWRKPHPAIYAKALELASVSPGQVVFVGDDFENDYTAPMKLGMRPVHLDRYGRRPGLEPRVCDFYGLKEILLPKE
jgi:putative hydrolase of the HAD superfamily